jgi:hypothetical protein
MFPRVPAAGIGVVQTCVLAEAPLVLFPTMFQYWLVVFDGTLAYDDPNSVCFVVVAVAAMQRQSMRAIVRI